MAVTLAFKCLETILTGQDVKTKTKNFKFKFIDIAVDAQIVLFWLLTGDSKTKSKVIKKRTKDITMTRNEIEQEEKIPTYFNYVETSKNHADYLTKGLTFIKLNENLKHCLSGPDWISDDISSWPRYELLSVPSDAISTLVHAQMTRNIE